MTDNIDVLHAFTKAYDDEMFCSNIKKNGNIEQTIQSLCSCNCCPRHMTCRPDYDKIKVLIDNTDATKTDEIIRMIEYETIFINNTSNKFVFFKSFMDMSSIIGDMLDIKDEDYDKIQQLVELVLENFCIMMNTFNSPMENQLIGKIFKIKLTSILSYDTEDKESAPKMSVELNTLFEWAMDMYQASRDISNIENRDFKSDGINNSCVCGCRSFVRSMLTVYSEEILQKSNKKNEKNLKKLK